MFKNSCGCGCFALVALLFGGVFIAVIYGNLADYRASSGWQKGQGKVISAQVETSTDSEGDSTYRALVRYYYYAGDVRYEAHRVRFGDHIYSGNRGSAEKVVEKYAPETDIEVYYDPEDPSDAVIERQLTTSAMVFAAVGGGALLAGLIGCLFMVIIPVLSLWQAVRKKYV